MMDLVLDFWYKKNVNSTWLFFIFSSGPRTIMTLKGCVSLALNPRLREGFQGVLHPPPLQKEFCKERLPH